MSVSPHQVLSRRYRPQAFSEMVGQESVARILGNALVAGRVGHAYLFVGPRGVGKTTSARIFAKAINCSRRAPDDPTPCGTCPSCVDVAAGTDLDVTEIDGASNSGVDDVRDLRQRVGYAAARSGHRIWIVDEVHMLSLQAFNAFLKTLEEPPPKVVFLFCTTEEHRLPETFRSRCQRVEFRPIGEAAIAARLADLAAREGVPVEPGVLAEIARTALGGLRDAESLLEQLVSSSAGGPVTLRDLEALSGRAPRALLEALRAAVSAGDAAGALDAADACLAGGAKPGVLLEQWLEAAREDLVAAARAGAGAEGPSLARAARSIELLLQKRQHLKTGAEGGLLVQVAAVELARLPEARDLDRLIEALEGGRVPGRPAQAPGAAPAEAPRPRAPVSAASAAPAAPRAAAVSPAPAMVSSPAAPANASAPPARPAPPGASPSGGAGAATDAAGCAARWPAFLDALRAEDARLAQLLAPARPVAVEEGGAVLVLDGLDAQARGALGRREGTLAFRRAARAAFGLDAAPRAAAPTGAAPRAPGETAPSLGASPPSASQGALQGSAGAGATRPHGRDARDHPKVRLVTEETDGTLLDVRPSGEERAGRAVEPGGT